jgi:hypothetical protein
VVLVALAVVAGLVVPAAQLAERSQQEHLAHVAGVHPHHLTIHLLEECCPHVGVCHPGTCGQTFEVWQCGNMYSSNNAVAE